jgi:enoyl-CoA hydratase
MSDPSFVRIEYTDDRTIATIVIDRQDKLNALNPDVIRELGAALESLGTDEEVLGVILTGAGERAFVAGADIGVLAQMTPTTGVEVSRQGQEVFRAIETFPRPVLAAVGGFALGGGCELALACHMRIASDNAVFGLPEVGLGIIPGYGGTIRLARLIGLGRAVELTLTGAKIDAARAESLGLVNQVVPRDELAGRALALMQTIVRNGPVALRFAMESIYHALDSTTEEALRHESALFGLLASTDDMREGMQAFLDKRRPEFRGE